LDNYCKRLIEVDLPIKRISAHARREKSIRHGHISTLHIWWARRPLAACRAVICAALWPDPANELCPAAFRDKVRAEMLAWTTHERQKLLSEESRKRFEKVRQKPAMFDNFEQLRGALLDFIADFANWDNSTVKEYLDTSRALTQAAHEALGGAPGTRPLVVDPFAGGGSIPLEALRVGADTFASDLNPVAVLLNKVVLEYIPKYGQRLADEVRKWGEWIKREAEKELAEFYSKDPDGATPIAYLWARTITCEGPGCGAEVPLMRSLWLAKKGSRSAALHLILKAKTKQVDFEIIENVKPKDVREGTIRNGSVTCPVCGFTTPVVSVRRQLKEHRGGAANARLFCVVTTRPGEQGRFYRLPTEYDLNAVRRAAAELERRKELHRGTLSLIPDESPPLDGTGSKGGGYRTRKYGITSFGDFFTPRQALSLATLAGLISKVGERMRNQADDDLIRVVQTCLALAVDRQADYGSSLCRWVPAGEFVGNTFGRQALPMVWDFCEVFPGSDSTGGFSGACSWVVDVLVHEIKSSYEPGQAEEASATTHLLPADAVHAFITDPPYYDSVPYADLSDFFYVWLKRSMLCLSQSELKELTPKSQECVVDLQRNQDRTHFEHTMAQAMAEGCRVLSPAGIGVIVFAHKSTVGWEAQLQAMVNSGWTITASWPIDTEMGARLRARNSAVLASSIHLVCRPRENPDGSLRTEDVGDWRDVLAELPRRIHEWMPRLAQEGVVGADAIFACLGPALEIFSRYSRVEKASGEVVTLKEYLVEVWAAVAKEALTVVFEGADASGFEADARLTAMWLWTLNAGATDAATGESAEDEETNDESENGAKNAKTNGYMLEYDAARKIAQGLGAHLEDLSHLVEIKGETATLLLVAARTHYLFGNESAAAPKGSQKKKETQLKLAFADELKVIEEESREWTGELTSKAGATVLDQLHQSMILFAAGRGEAIRRFLVEDGVGRNQMFWRLAQAMSALYPSGTDEKRWVDGVLARKKGLGL
jgi:putative DNA methylase